jgi:hypothetical protein
VPWLRYLSFIGKNTVGALAKSLDVAAWIKAPAMPGLRRRSEKPLAPCQTPPNGNPSFGRHVPRSLGNQEVAMNAIIYLVGLVVVVLFILSLVGLR